MKRIYTSTYLIKEDYWAIWIGGFLLITGLILFLTLGKPSEAARAHEYWENIQQHETKEAPFKTVAFYQAKMNQEKVTGSGSDLGSILNRLTSIPHSWKENPLHSIFMSSQAAEKEQARFEEQYQQKQKVEEEAFAAATYQEDLARQQQFSDSVANQLAREKIAVWVKARESLDKAQKKYEAGSYNQLFWLLGLMVFLGLLFGTGSHFMGIPFRKYFPGFVMLFLLACLAFIISGNQWLKSIGFGYAAWAIVMGLLISNTVGTPAILKRASLTEFYIKTGLVILGAEILLGKILAIGLPGIFVAWIVTPIVLVATYWFGQRVMKITSRTLNITISADMSVCGVSAAVATAAACNAKKEELTLAIGLSMIFTSIMMILMPIVIKALGMPEVLGGAWIGGTIDATGAVVAAGAFLGEKALSVAATIKMIQNILIGVIAFFVAVYFTMTDPARENKNKVTVSEIWKRFPKFILGFLGASVLFTLIYSSLGENLGYTLIDEGVLDTFSKNLREWLFCLAFLSIGLSLNYRDLRSSFTGGKPLILYISGQAFNLLLTLGMAYLMFYIVFPEITSQL